MVAAVEGVNEVGKADAAEGDGIKEHQGKTQLCLNPVFFRAAIVFLEGGSLPALPAASTNSTSLIYVNLT